MKPHRLYDTRKTSGSFSWPLTWTVPSNVAGIQLTYVPNLAIALNNVMLELGCWLTIKFEPRTLR